MFIGHIALGLAAKKAAPKVSMPVLIIAAQFADLLWPVFVMVGLEIVNIKPGDTKFTPFEFVSYPWSHSLLMLCVWAAVFAFFYRRRTGDEKGSLVIAALVVSHWVLDFVSHRADMPLYPGGPKFGLALWNHPTATIVVEVVMFAAGVAIYEGMTKGKDKKGQYSFWLMVVLMLVAYVANIGSAPPPSAGALATGAIMGIIIGTLLTIYVERNRTLEHPEPNPTGRTRTPVQPFY